MNYLIDGYNLMFRLGSRGKTSLEKRRNSLITLLNTELAPLKGNVRLVFDSCEQIQDFAQCAKKTHLDVIYAPKNKTADEYIVELVEQENHPKTLVVVTSDNELARQCKSFGAQTKSIEDFFFFITKKQKRKSLEKPAYKESSSELQRLIKIFEEKLGDN